MWVALGISAAEAASLVVAAKRWLSFVDRRSSSERRSSADARNYVGSWHEWSRTELPLER